MDHALTVFLPIFAFMLIPVWIPVITGVLGALADRVVPVRKSPAEQAVALAKARAAQNRTALVTEHVRAVPTPVRRGRRAAALTSSAA